MSSPAPKPKSKVKSTTNNASPSASSASAAASSAAASTGYVIANPRLRASAASDLTWAAQVRQRQAHQALRWKAQRELQKIARPVYDKLKHEYERQKTSSAAPQSYLDPSASVQRAGLTIETLVRATKKSWETPHSWISQRIQLIGHLKKCLLLNIDGQKLSSLHFIATKPSAADAQTQEGDTETEADTDQYTDMKHPFQYCTKVQVFSAMHNFLRRIDYLTYFPQLTQLHLSMNQIQRLEGIATLKQLQKLHLSNNEIPKLEGFIEEDERKRVELERQRAEQVAENDQEQKNEPEHSASEANADQNEHDADSDFDEASPISVLPFGLKELHLAFQSNRSVPGLTFDRRNLLALSLSLHTLDIRHSRVNNVEFAKLELLHTLTSLNASDNLISDINSVVFVLTSQSDSGGSRIRTLSLARNPFYDTVRKARDIIILNSNARLESLDDKEITRKDREFLMQMKLRRGNAAAKSQTAAGGQRAAASLAGQSSYSNILSFQPSNEYKASKARLRPQGGFAPSLPHSRAPSYRHYGQPSDRTADAPLAGLLNARAFGASHQRTVNESLAQQHNIDVEDYRLQYFIPEGANPHREWQQSNPNSAVNSDPAPRDYEGRQMQRQPSHPAFLPPRPEFLVSDPDDALSDSLSESALHDDEVLQYISFAPIELEGGITNTNMVDAFELIHLSKPQPPDSHLDLIIKTSNGAKFEAEFQRVAQAGEIFDCTVYSCVYRVEEKGNEQQEQNDESGEAAEEKEILLATQEFKSFCVSLCRFDGVDMVEMQVAPISERPNGKARYVTGVRVDREIEQEEHTDRQYYDQTAEEEGQFDQEQDEEQPDEEDQVQESGDTGIHHSLEDSEEDSLDEADTR